MADFMQYDHRPSIMADQRTVADNSPPTDHVALDPSYLEFYYPLVTNMDLWLPSSHIGNTHSSLPFPTAAFPCQIPTANPDIASTNNIATFIDQNLYGVRKGLLSVDY